MIAGILLAGGRSQRMGQPKSLLKAGDLTFLERGVHALMHGGCEEVVVIQNDEDPAVIELIAASGARAVRGAGPGTEQIESLRMGLKSLPHDAEAAVVLPVDCPLVKPETVSVLIEAFLRTGPPIVRPNYKGRHGHPVLFSTRLFTELLDHDLPEGARSVVHRHAAEIVEVDVDDGGVMANFDTPEEYREQFGERP